MIVAITGGTGFIGKKLVQHHLARGDEVRVLTRRLPNESGFPDQIKWHRGDLADGNDLQAFVDRADVLYHCAGEIRDVGRMERLHVTGTRNLLKAASGRIGRWVQLSSVGVYGQPRSGEVTEQSLPNPVGVYEITKQHSDDLVETAGKQDRFEWTILRPSIVFGEDMPNQSLFQMIDVISRGHFFFIGKPGASANYIHVDNVVHALVCCALSPQAAGKVFNLSDYATLETIVGMIAKQLDADMPRLYITEYLARLAARVGHKLMKRFPLTESRVDALTTRVIYPIDRIRQELNYTHVISMEASITCLIHAWRMRRGNI